MTFSQFYLIAVVAFFLFLVVRNRLRSDLAALLIALFLGLGQFLGLGLFGTEHTPQNAAIAFSGLSEPVVLTLLSLFIITRSLYESGVTRWIARQIVRFGGRSERRLIVLYAATTAFLSLFMNNLAAGALLLPSAMETCRRTGVKPSKLLIPIAYGSLLGGTATYFDTTSIVVSNLLTLASPPQEMLHVWDFMSVGGLIVLAGIIFMAWFGPRLLPNRTPPAELMITRDTGSDLEKYYRLSERLWEAVVMPDSPLANKSLAESGLGEQLGLVVAGMGQIQNPIFSPPPEQIIRPTDILLVIGREERVQQLAQMGVRIKPSNGNNHLNGHDVVLIEAVPVPRSHVLGHTLCDLEFRSKYDFTVLALHRGERSYRTAVSELELQMGDSLLMLGPRDKLKRLQDGPDLIVLEPDIGDQPVQRLQAGITVGVIVAGIIGSILGLPIHFSMLGGALLLVVSRMMSMEEAYRAIEWPVIFLVAGMYSVSLAMMQTGLAQQIGGFIVKLVTPLGPLGLATGAYLMSASLTQVMGGQVTQLVTGPVMISAAISLQTSPQAVALATAIGCEAAFLLPFAHPINLLMLGPANYEFKDFFRIGWRLTIISFVMLLVGLVLFWRL